MRTRSVGLAALCAAATTVAIAQPPAPPRPLPGNLTPVAHSEPAAAKRDLSKFPPVVQHFHLSAQRGAEWLFRMNQPTGSFAAGWRPDLNQPLDGDHFLRQASATLTLARAARYFQNEAYAARARQALLTLLAETGPDARDPRARSTTAPSAVVNRLAAAGLLVAIIHELPNPPDDLLLQGEQLAYFIALQQKPDGSLAYTDTPEAVADPDGANTYPGLALYGLARSNVLRAAAWKPEVIRKACAYYRGWWRDHKHPALVATQTAAYSEAFVQSKDRTADATLADFTFEMNDWLCGLQLNALDPRHPQWRGGFPEFAQGKPTAGEPRIGTAQCATSLCDACRATRQKPDAGRFARYRDAAGRALQFSTTLQYTDANTQHFAAGYREQVLLGGFFSAPDDGTLRLENNQQAVGALLSFLANTADAQ